MTALGLHWPECQPVVASALQYNARRKRATVLVLTHATPAWLVAADIPVELLPSRTALKALGDDEWRHWITRRWEILLAKWDVRSEIAIGQSFDRYLSEQIGKR